MKRTLLFFLMGVIIIIYGKSYFADANILITETEPLSQQWEDEKLLIEELFKKRSELWEQVYQEDVDLESFAKQLERIVAEPTLTADIKEFQELKQFPTEIDKVLDLKVCHIGDIHYGKSQITAKATIIWYMEGMDSQYEEEIKYIIVIKEAGGKWKLCEYTVYQ